MVDVKVDLDLLIDFNKLVLELRHFMSLNMVQIDSHAKNPQGKIKLKELAIFCNKNIVVFNELFKEPVQNNVKYNSEILSKRLNELLRLIHSILSYSGSILKDYYPQMYKERFSHILDMYVDFRDKYKIN